MSAKPVRRLEWPDLKQTASQIRKVPTKDKGILEQLKEEERFCNHD